MANATPLVTVEAVAAYLEANAFDPADISLLSGGTANFVYRVSWRDGETTFIYKHAAPYLHSNENFAFDPVRMDYEHLALQILPPLLSKELPHSNVHAVKCFDYDKETKVLRLQDGGSTDLKTAYSFPELDMREIGTGLGHWLAALHRCTTQTSLSVSLSKDEDFTANNPVAVSVYRHSYRNLHLALAEFGHDAEFGKRIDEGFGSKLATDNECVCHGDFWPGNVLLNVGGSEKEREEVRSTVVDWELVRRGCSATDVGQFAAEAFLLDRFRGARGLRTAFLDAYASAMDANSTGTCMGREWVRRMAVHAGVHIAFWPTRVEWTNRAGTQKLVDIGVAVLKAALDDDFSQLLAAELLKDVGVCWNEVWDRV